MPGIILPTPPPVAPKPFSEPSVPVWGKNALGIPVVTGSKPVADFTHGGMGHSSAFLAGHAHGAALAIKHHMAAATGTPAPPRQAAPRKAAATVATGTGATGTTTTTTAPPQTLDDILAQARAAAAADTQSQVNTLKAQQALYDTQAQAKAGQATQAYQAAAQYLQGQGDTTAASYNNAAQVLAGLAQGYSGQTGQDAQSAAAQIQAQLAASGAPAGGLKTATGQTPQPVALSNVLYGLGGAIPGNLLVTSGQAAAAAQRGLPASMLGYGEQQAAAALTAGQQQAAGLSPQILAARAGQPKLTQQYLAALQNQVTNQALAASLIGSRSTASQVQQQNADANTYRANTGRLALRAKVTTAAQAAKQKGGLHGLTPATYQRWSSKALGAARNYHKPWTDSKGNTNAPLSWQQFMTAAQSQGIPTWVIIQEGRKVYSLAEIKQGLIPAGA